MERTRSALPAAPLTDPDAAWAFVGVRVPRHLRDALWDRARVDESSASRVVRAALRAYLGEPPRSRVNRAPLPHP
jgi:hypothetical protein